MTWYWAGAIAAAASFALGVAGFQLCRRSGRKNPGGFIDGPAFVGLLVGYPVGTLAGAVAGLAGARILGGPYSLLPALLLALLPLLVPTLSLFLHLNRPR